MMLSTRNNRSTPLPPQILAGFPSGSFCVIEQDEHGIFSTLLFNGMLSLSLLNGDRITVFADDDDGDVMKLVQALPKKTKSKEKSAPNPISDMKIAFMYKNAPVSCESCSFDYGNLITEKDLSENNLDISNIKTVKSDHFKLLIQENFKGTVFVKETNTISLPTLLLLKLWTRLSPDNKILITSDPRYLSPVAINRIRSLADGVVQLESFKPGPKPYPEFDGVVNVIKIPRVNSININSSNKIDTLDMGFQWKSNRYFVIDKLSLPPDISETASRSSSSTSSCASTGNKSLDF